VVERLLRGAVDSAVCDIRRRPSVDGALYPDRHRDRADMSTLSDEIRDCPVPLADWTSSFLRDTSSARRSPHPSRMEIMAISRVQRRLSPSDFSRSKRAFGAALGLENDWLVHVLKTTGNYREIYGRAFGGNSDRASPQDLNQIGSSRDLMNFLPQVRTSACANDGLWTEH
jgi:hypothetical protein